MKDVDHNEPLRDEAFRKIGRNVVHFQQLEAAFKRLSVESHIEGSPDTLGSAAEAKAEEIRKLPMGSVVKRVISEVYAVKTEIPEPPEQLSTAWACVGFKIEVDADTREETKQMFEALVSERNELIHHDLANMDFSSAEECSRLIHVLDDQNQRIVEQLKWLNELFASQDEVRAFMASDEFKQMWQQQGGGEWAWSGQGWQETGKNPPTGAGE